MEGLSSPDRSQPLQPQQTDSEPGDSILAFTAEQLRQRRAYRLRLERERTNQARIAHNRDTLIWHELDNATSSERAPEPR